ncbi:MAG: DNA polymerase III subunit chi [Methylotenera sp.]|nr:DNA polymerase III subunit chi [Methylotenera sp.]
MTRVEFFFNVPDKLAKAAELCEKAVAKGRHLTIFTADEAMSESMQQQLWRHSEQSFLPSSTPHETESEFVAIILDSTGEKLLQDDVLINLQTQYPPFFSRFRYLVEMVGTEEVDKVAARARFRFYKDRGYEIKSTDVAA